MDTNADNTSSREHVAPREVSERRAGVTAFAGNLPTLSSTLVGEHLLRARALRSPADPAQPLPGATRGFGLIMLFLFFVMFLCFLAVVRTYVRCEGSVTSRSSAT